MLLGPSSLGLSGIQLGDVATARLLVDARADVNLRAKPGHSLDKWGRPTIPVGLSLGRLITKTGFWGGLSREPSLGLWGLIRGDQGGNNDFLDSPKSVSQAQVLYASGAARGVIQHACAHRSPCFIGNCKAGPL